MPRRNRLEDKTVSVTKIKIVRKWFEVQERTVTIGRVKFKEHDGDLLRNLRTVYLKTRNNRFVRSEKFPPNLLYDLKRAGLVVETDGGRVRASRFLTFNWDKLRRFLEIRHVKEKIVILPAP